MLSFMQVIELYTVNNRCLHIIPARLLSVSSQIFYRLLSPYGDLVLARRHANGQ